MLGFIHFSAKLNKLLCIKLLYVLGANIDLEDSNGLKVIDYIENSQNDEIINYIKKISKSKINN